MAISIPVNRLTSSMSDIRAVNCISLLCFTYCGSPGNVGTLDETKLVSDCCNVVISKCPDACISAKSECSVIWRTPSPGRFDKIFRLSHTYLSTGLSICKSRTSISTSSSRDASENEGLNEPTSTFTEPENTVASYFSVKLSACGLKFLTSAVSITFEFFLLAI